MLKIKDSVDLKELEKFGFKKCNAEKEVYVWFGEVIAVSIEKRVEERQIVAYFEIMGVQQFQEVNNLLFDLIQAGLVEKVSGE